MPAKIFDLDEVFFAFAAPFGKFVRALILLISTATVALRLQLQSRQRMPFHGSEVADQ
jgi:hypothetical protein